MMEESNENKRSVVEECDESNKRLKCKDAELICVGDFEALNTG